MYNLNGVNIATYGIIPGHAPGSNIAVAGCFDMPARTGTTFHEWGDEDGVEAYVATEDLFFAGRDITFYGSIFGTESQIKTYIDSLQTAISAFTDLVVFSTPYGSFNVLIKDVKVNAIFGAASVIISFREPVVSLSGTLPATGSNTFTFDSIPFASFGLYLSKADALHDLPEGKEQQFTSHGIEGFQITKRSKKLLGINGFIVGSSIADFQSKISALCALFSSSGTRTIVIRGMSFYCFAAEGFKVENFNMGNNYVIASFKINLILSASSISPDGDPPVDPPAGDLITIVTTLVGDFMIDLGGSGSCTITWPDETTTTFALGGPSRKTKTITAGGTITISNPAGITYLVASYRDITSISGLDKCPGITYIDLSSNLLTAFNTYAAWTALERLAVTDNQITSLSTFAAWTALQELKVSNNPLTALATFSEWTALGEYGLAADGCDLTASEVNAILTEALASGITYGSIDLSGGTNAAPTGAGITAKNSLIAAGVTVTTN